MLSNATNQLEVDMCNLATYALDHHNQSYKNRHRHTSTLLLLFGPLQILGLSSLTHSIHAYVQWIMILVYELNYNLIRENTFVIEWFAGINCII